MDSIDDPTWPQYPETILVFSELDNLTVDLRSDLSEQTRATLASLSVGVPFAIVSAASPKGLGENEDVNQASFDALRSEVLRRNLRHSPVVGKSVNGEHRELALAVGASVQHVRTLAVDAGQSAYFWYDGSAFWLAGARVTTPPQRLPIK